ncbi:conserved Plasmodium protein, unknown function [Plasmodium gallinaceum]|uniref:Uncharacterized protein n=1 Tax=Plasmodium gallinaceum TaxID=5849 RepID=A0A1J1GTD8_PLAGA|nr:conserved Plasmodium protein, unknown function [Plasmodium gallinaceum]CRG95780.1 conserved Plasmodium protein, unknown function [Plasmodium gallinaceum]
MKGEYSSKPPTYRWDMNDALNKLKGNIMDLIFFVGFVISILGSFYFFYWLKSREVRTICNKDN